MAKKGKKKGKKQAEEPQMTEEERQKALEELCDQVEGHVIPHVYVGSLEEVQKDLAEYEAYLADVVGEDEFAKCKVGYTYNVKLFFENDKETFGFGVASDYESARKLAEGNFPFEPSDALKEKVIVEADYIFRKKAIEQFKEKGKPPVAGPKGPATTTLDYAIS